MGTTVGEAEKLLILKTLEATNNNKTRAAEILGISLKTLHNKLKEYGRPQDTPMNVDEWKSITSIARCRLSGLSV